MRIPSYSRHKSTGQAYVKLRGKFIYLGKHGTAESQRKYEQVIGEYLSTGRQTPATVDTKDGITVGQLFACYLRHCRDYYQRNGVATQEYDSHVYLRNKIDDIASIPADQLTPASVDGLRQGWIQRGNTRKYINKSVGRLVRMYKWGVSKELVDVQVWQRLTALSGLKSGRSKARETDPIRPVDDATFEAACEFMPDETAATARIQRLTGARPGELWILRPCDIDRSGDVWMYRPQSHKTQHHNKDRQIFIGPKAQAILLPYLLRPAKDICFRCPSGKPWSRYSFREAIHLSCKYAVVTDCDPEGCDIPNAFGLSLRDDFGLHDSQLAIIKAALTFEQAQSMDLHQGQLAKETSSRFQRYKEQFGDRCWELESIPTSTLRDMVEDTIRRVIDVDAFEDEVDRQADEQIELDDHREQVQDLLEDL